jgi:lysine 6-dehydrogenase
LQTGLFLTGILQRRPGGIIPRIVVLGGGRVGSAIVRDLAAEDGFSVLGVDLDPVRVERMTEFGADGVVADLSDLANVSQAVSNADLVVGAVPGFMGYRTVERVLQEGRPKNL